MLGNLYTGLYRLSSDSNDSAERAREGSSSEGREEARCAACGVPTEAAGGGGGTRGFRRTRKWQSLSGGQARCTNKGRSSGWSFRSYSWDGYTWKNTFRNFNSVEFLVDDELVCNI